MTRIPGWLRRLRQAIPLLRSHLGKHTQQALETWLDMQYARRLRRMNARPVYTPPQTYRVVPDYCLPGSYSSVTEVHHGRPGELHKDVLAACIDRPHLLDDIRAERTRNLPPEEVMPHAAVLQHRRGRHVNLPALETGPAIPPRGTHGVTAVRQAQGGEPGTNQRQGNWKPRPTYTPHQVIPAHVIAALEHASSEDTTVSSLHPAIRADVDGDNNGQITDRYFSQINLGKIFADLGITYTPHGGDVVKGEAQVFTWDWRQQPDMNAIALAVFFMSGGKVFMSPIDTGTDEYAWVVSDRPLSPAQARKLWAS